MRVGLFVGDVGATEGGGFTFVDNFLELLRAHAHCDHEFVVCHLGQPGAKQFAHGFAELDVSAGAAALRTSRERAPRWVHRAMDRLSPPRTSLDPHARVYRSARVDLVVTINPWTPTSMDVPFASFLWDVQHRNNPWFPEVSELGGWAARERLLANLAQRSSVVFTGTERGADEIVDYFRTPRDRIHVLPFPVPEFAARAARTTPRPELLLPLALPAQYVFYPAQFWPHKNHVTLLHAIRRLRDQRGGGLGAVFVGSDKGNLAYVREQANAMGIEDSVRFLGFVEQPILVELYRSAVALAFPTYCGPDNLPPLEAFALGCPVVASDVPGAREQLGDAALLFEPSDDEGLAGHLAAVTDEGDTRAALIARGRQRADKLTGERCAAGFIRALDNFARIRRAWKH